MEQSIKEKLEKIKSKYISDDPSLECLNSPEKGNDILFKLGDDDDYEICLVQCLVNPSLLKGQFIKMPGKTRTDEVEVICKDLPDTKPIILATKTPDNSGKYALIKIPCVQQILIRNNLRTFNNENGNHSNDTTIQVPFPENLKQRHPLFGANFEDKIVLDKNIAKRLEKCDKISCILPRPIKRIKECTDEMTALFNVEVENHKHKSGSRKRKKE